MKNFIRFLLLASSTVVWADSPPLHFDRLNLSDGRTLTNVTVKTYDSVSGRVLFIAEGKASTAPLNVFPAPLDKQISATAPRSGSTATIVPQRVLPPREEPTPTDADRTAANASEAAKVDAELEQHSSAARTRAERYFRTEYNLGSSAVRVRSLDLDTRRPEAVPGWGGRFRTQGRAFIEFFDSKGWSYSRTTAAFEVLTEQKPDGQITISDFSLRNDVDAR